MFLYLFSVPGRRPVLAIQMIIFRLRSRRTRFHHQVSLDRPDACLFIFDNRDCQLPRTPICGRGLVSQGSSPPSAWPLAIQRHTPLQPAHHFIPRIGSFAAGGRQTPSVLVNVHRKEYLTTSLCLMFFHDFRPHFLPLFRQRVLPLRCLALAPENPSPQEIRFFFKSQLPYGRPISFPLPFPPFCIRRFLEVTSAFFFSASSISRCSNSFLLSHPEDRLF